MRASCIICLELLTHDICAVICGHVFHMTCMMKWMNGKKVTVCPQCRAKVVKGQIIEKLYFTQPEMEPNDRSSSELQNELNDVLRSNKDKNECIKQLEDDKKKEQERVSALRTSNNDLQEMYKLEATRNQTLGKELKGYKTQQQEAERAMKEATHLREKLKQLQNLDSLRNGLMSDIEERAQHANTRDLVEWVIIQEKEMKRKRIECRQLQQGKDKIYKECRNVNKCLQTKTKELYVVEDRLNILEDDLKNVEGQNTSLKRKLEALQKSVASPSGVASSLAYRLINESPAPEPKSKRPRLSERGPQFNLEIDQLDSPDVSPPSYNQCKSECKEFGTKYVKLTSVSSAFRTEQSKAKKSTVSTIAPIVGGYNILKRKTGSGLLNENDNSAIRVGYNGFGGHTKFIQPKGFVKGNLKKGLLSTSNKSNFTPPLPTLNFS